MARPSERAKIQARVAEDISAAFKAEPLGLLPINIHAVHKRTGIHRETLRKYCHEMIAEAEQRLALLAKSHTQRARATIDERIRMRDQRIAELEGCYEGALVKLALIEGNAQRLGIDPAGLYAPLAAPMRDVPYRPRRR